MKSLLLWFSTAFLLQPTLNDGREYHYDRPQTAFNEIGGLAPPPHHHQQSFGQAPPVGAEIIHFVVPGNRGQQFDVNMIRSQRIYEGYEGGQRAAPQKQRNQPHTTPHINPLYPAGPQGSQQHYAPQSQVPHNGYPQHQPSHAQQHHHQAPNGYGQQQHRHDGGQQYGGQYSGGQQLGGQHGGGQQQGGQHGGGQQQGGQHGGGQNQGGQYGGGQQQGGQYGGGQQPGGQYGGGQQPGGQYGGGQQQGGQYGGGQQPGGQYGGGQQPGGQYGGGQQPGGQYGGGQQQGGQYGGGQQPGGQYGGGQQPGGQYGGGQQQGGQYSGDAGQAFGGGAAQGFQGAAHGIAAVQGGAAQLSNPIPGEHSHPNYVSQSEAGQLDHYPHKQVTPGDPRAFEREVTVCYPNGQCEKKSLGPGEVDPRQLQLAAEARARAAPVSDKCRLIAEANAAAQIAAGGQNAQYGAPNGAYGLSGQPENQQTTNIPGRPQDRRLFPYGEVPLKQDPYN